MASTRAAICIALLWPLAALAQRAPPPDEAWKGYPGEPATSPTPAVRERPLSAPPLPPPSPAREPSARLSPLLPAAQPPERNDVSMFGAESLGPFRRGFAASLGFPLVGLRAGVGLLDRLDVGFALDSLYGVMNDFRVYGRLQLFRGGDWSGAVALEGGAAHFTQRACAEKRGPRWLTGRRNYNLAPGLLLSHRGEGPQATRWFFDARYQLSVDTEPCQNAPLGGLPPAVQLGHNFPLRAGAELPFTSKTSFLFTFGFDVHARPEDAALMPTCAVGVVTSI